MTEKEDHVHEREHEGSRWERLPDPPLQLTTCDRTGFGHARSGEDRCGKPASWVRRSRCGCGAVDMTVHLCHDHRVQREVDEKERMKRQISKLTRTIRDLNHDLRNDDEALDYGLGIVVLPRPKPDEFWRKHNPGKIPEEGSR